jgi:hypothetical protein
MKKIILSSALFIAVLSGCKQASETPVEDVVVIENVDAFGEEFEVTDIKTKDQMASLYASLNEGDTLAVQFESEIQATCKKKGCWMSLDLGNEDKAIVRFKDYGFFVPKEGAEGKSSIVNGKAFLAVTSVDQLKHDAKDGGQSQAAIDSIVQPKVVKMFLADGVLIRQ